MSHEPDPRANGISTNDYCALLPRRRYSHEARGLVLRLPSSGLTVVPFQEAPGGSWYAAIVEGHGPNPVGGYHISVSRTEVETAVEVTLGPEIPVHVVNTAKEAEALADGVRVLTRTHGWLAKETVDGGTRWSRKAFGKVSVLTVELAGELPVIVLGSDDDHAAPAPVIPEASGPRYVHTPEEAEALPDRESILTPGGLVFRKWVGYYREGEAAWCRELYDPITTDLLSEELHFPAKVLGTTADNNPTRREASHV